MAAMLGVGRVGFYHTRYFTSQILRTFPIVQARFLSDKNSGSGQKAPEQKVKQDSSEDKHTYKVPEYYAHTKDTYADFEIEMANQRQSQPDPRVPYFHHYPWDKS